MKLYITSMQKQHKILHIMPECVVIPTWTQLLSLYVHVIILAFNPYYTYSIYDTKLHLCRNFNTEKNVAQSTREAEIANSANLNIQYIVHTYNGSVPLVNSYYSLLQMYGHKLGDMKKSRYLWAKIIQLLYLPE